MASHLNIVGLSNKGLFQLNFEEPYEEKQLRDGATQNIRSVVVSPKGNYLAYRTDKKVEIIKCIDWTLAAAIDGNVRDMFFSPMDTYLTVWEMFLITKDHPQGQPNLHVYSSSSGELVGSFVQKNQSGWHPKWSSDEKLFTIQSNSKILIYEDAKFDRYTHNVQAQNLQAFSVSPSVAPNYYLSVFTLGKSGQPAFWRIFKFPQFDVSHALVSRSLFQADKATFYWNRRGTNVFTMTQTDVDKTGGSYYGKQALSYGDVKGNAGNMTFSKEGPIHAIAWNPGNWNEWVAVYGHAPAKATLFNAKCDPLYEFGTGAWNAIYFPPEGNIVLLGGFGNIATGHISVWDVRGFKKLGECSAPDTTYLQWDPRGETFLTATTYPRLTVGNGYKFWHYTGVLMYKRSCEDKENLLSICWRPGTYPKSELSKSAPKGIAETTPKAVGAYRPPGARNKPSTFTLHEHEKPHKPGQNSDVTPSKQAIKQKEKREARKARKAEEKAERGDTSPQPPPPNTTNKAPFVSTGDPEKDKKIKNLNKKLNDIEKLKQQKAAGKQLELNQLAKIDNEAALLQEIAQLRL
ncbi:eukaryotic translation initiation factor 2A isoform X1 [Leptidea sinapis]|nr:eukaryotic translation initiation factor 2A isoform X1 [Leptidea sinapis]XP_050673372.1 eukaryotic translation initiation factor 2A isoform X2 [Leptidea sinapis]XP_050673373.1 eukaryotic translation initiation factor 2A isoform X3 [Leptidea sinapis]XP_050673374.1 eukaryotic translation initiation factor 2A isoform X4 [Leptidea sinapis]XP_050673375.1 eukaryotic translation initiation factor 2A isoform X2 [Leptidea sinapis]XP_050673376.1 eukaryotic translation initiation factor 2A isoform X1 